MTATLSYVEYGPEHDELPLVLLHAFPLPGAMFEPLASRLASDHRVLVPDLRGFGASPDPGDAPPSVDVMADDVVALLDELGVDRAVVGGVSMGGYVAMALLRRDRDRVSRLIMIDTKASEDDHAGRANRERVARAVLDNGPRALRPMLDTLLGTTTHRTRPQIVEQVARWLDQARPTGVAWAQRAMAARPASFATLAAAAIPGDVIVGAEDGITTREDALAMSSAFDPPAPVHVIAGAGHLSPVENPDAVADTVREVLQQKR